MDTDTAGTAPAIDTKETCDAAMYECDCRVCTERFYALHCDPVYPSLLSNGRGGFSPEYEVGGAR